MTRNEARLRRLAVEDVEAVLDLFNTVGWVRTPAIVEQSIRWQGERAFCLATPEQILAVGGAVVYGPELAWVGMMATRQDSQKRGYGTRIMNAVLDYLQTRRVACIALDATPVGRLLYERCGFRAHSHVEMWVKGVVTPGPTLRAQLMQPEDLPEVIRLDGEYFGVERPQIIRDYYGAYSERAWVDKADGEVVGFLIAKPRIPDGKVKIGPWVHRTPEGAEKLLLAALNNPGAPTVRLYIPEANVTAKTIARRHGFSCEFIMTRMTYGGVGLPFPSMNEQYSIATSMTG